MSRVRLVTAQVTLALVSDDGEHLAPMEPRHASIAAADLDRLPDLIREAIAAAGETVTEGDLS